MTTLAHQIHAHFIQEADRQKLFTGKDVSWDVFRKNIGEAANLEISFGARSDTRAWLYSPKRQPSGKHHFHTQPYYAIGINTTNHKIKILERNVHINGDGSQKIQKTINLLRNPEQKLWNKIMSFDILDQASAQIHQSFKELRANLDRVMTISVRKHLRDPALRQFIDVSMQPLIDRMEEECDITRYLDVDAFRFVLSNKMGVNNVKGSQLLQYNHIIEAPSLRTRDFRQGALEVMKPIGKLYLSNTNLWQQIDSGASTHQALAKALNIKVSTVRLALRDPKYLSCMERGVSGEDCLRHLDAFDPNLWPKDWASCLLFGYMVQYAMIGQQYYSHPSTHIIASMAKEPVDDPSKRWYQIGARKLDYQATLIDASVFQKRINAFKDRSSHISDMKRDVANKVILPLLLLGLKTKGYAVLNQNQLVTPALRHIEDKIWLRSSFGEQEKANKYWHSERVNFSNRLRSAADIASTDCWPPLLSEPVKIRMDEGTVVFTSLSSDMALQEEHKIMSHCIDTYSSRCVRNGYHVLTMESRQGGLRSTLTLKPPSNNEISRTLVFNDNRMYDNHRPPDWFNRAAHELIKLIKDEEITVDWEAIESNRALAQSRGFNDIIGYDYEDDDRRARVFRIYKPLWPRRIPSAARKDLTKFAEWLGIGELVSSLIDKAQQIADPAKTGLVPIKEYKPQPVIYPIRPHRVEIIAPPAP